MAIYTAYKSWITAIGNLVTSPRHGGRALSYKIMSLTHLKHTVQLPFIWGLRQGIGVMVPLNTSVICILMTVFKDKLSSFCLRHLVCALLSSDNVTCGLDTPSRVGFQLSESRRDIIWMTGNEYSLYSTSYEWRLLLFLLCIIAHLISLFWLRVRACTPHSSHCLVIIMIARKHFISAQSQHHS